MASGTEIQPHRITQPFQLMAAWFVMLIALEGIFAAAAINLQAPHWVPMMFAIAMIALPLLIIRVVFVMQTKFRPQLQEGEFYYKWLKDSQAYEKVQVTPRHRKTTAELEREGRRLEGELSRLILEANVLSRKPELHIEPPRDGRAVTNTPELENKSRYRIELSDLPSANTLVEQLTAAGFNAGIYADSKPSSFAEDEGIWVGRYVPFQLVIEALDIVRQSWPHLKYILLTGAATGEPEEVHYELFFGGSTATAIRYGCQPWGEPDFLKLRAAKSQSELHEEILRKIGHPRDVETIESK